MGSTSPTLSPSTPHGTSPEASWTRASGAQGSWSRLGIWGAALAAGALFAGAALLWWHNGTTVFFDTMAAGIGSCM